MTTDRDPRCQATAPQGEVGIGVPSGAGRDVVVVAGGVPPAPTAAEGLPDDAYVIAADSGLDYARGLGLEVDLVIGDMDSVRAESLAAAAEVGIRIEQHPAAKDETDLELALARAIEGNPTQLVVIGGDAGRFDHLMGVALLIASPRYAAVRVEARLGSAVVHVVRDRVVLHGDAGSVVTLLPVHGRVHRVTTQGLVYPLAGEDLAPGTTRGLSNQMIGETATVGVRRGVLLVVQPHALG